MPGPDGQILTGRENSHLILLCENNTGYQNLMYLISEGFLTGYYYKPRIDYNLIREHHEGLICLSACLSGDLPKMLLNGQDESAHAYVKEMQEIFGEKNFYIEIMDHNLREEKTVLPRLIALAREMNVPLVATNDCHYLEKKDAHAQEVLMCIRPAKRWRTTSACGWRRKSYMSRAKRKCAPCLNRYRTP